MATVKIKICGITTLEEVESINVLKPDYIGFVFAESQRQVTKEQATSLKASLVKDILSVGVFVNHPIEEVVQLVEEGTIEYVQLHGDEDADYIQRLKEQIDVPIIKAIPVGDEWIIHSLDVDYYLLDKKSSIARGGLGESFDWALIEDVDKPYFLAGGIDEYNIEIAMAYQPYCIDVSSGVEVNGKKDREKINRVIKKVRDFCG